MKEESDSSSLPLPHTHTNESLFLRKERETFKMSPSGKIF